MYTGWSPTYIAIDMLWVGFRLAYFIRHQYYCQKSEPLRTYKQRFYTFYDASRAQRKGWLTRPFHNSEVTF
jgi:hypothetical protein